MKIDAGTTFGRLTVIEDGGARRVRCRCACGTVVTVERHNLRSERQRSCGCLRREKHRERCDSQIARRAERFWSRVQRRDAEECWPWAGRLDEKGYGQTQWDGRPRKAHAVAYELTIGPIAEGLEPDHTCHDAGLCQLGDACPHRACCNPSHLEPVTHRANSQRAAYARQVCAGGHPLPAPGPNGRRVCRECANRRNREYKQRQAMAIYDAVMRP